LNNRFISTPSSTPSRTAPVAACCAGWLAESGLSANWRRRSTCPSPARQAGLVRRRIAGRTHYCRLEASRMKEARDWINHYERFWTDRLDVLESLLLQDAEDRKGDGE
jgi:hypothetical protein